MLDRCLKDLIDAGPPLATATATVEFLAPSADAVNTAVSGRFSDSSSSVVSVASGSTYDGNAGVGAMTLSPRERRRVSTPDDDAYGTNIRYVAMQQKGCKAVAVCIVPLVVHWWM